MRVERQVALYRSLLERALNAGQSDLIKQYTWGLFFLQSDRIKELEKELATIKLLRYKKGA